MTVETRIGKITASKMTLNSLALQLFVVGDEESETGDEKAAKYCRGIAGEIHDALAATGYYKSIKAKGKESQ